MAELESNRNALSISEEAPSTFRNGRRSIGISLLLFVVVAWAFLPALRNGFLNFDDGCFVSATGEIQRGLTSNSVGWVFSHPVAGNWHPMTVLSHMLDCQLYGLKPWGHHLTNMLVHALTAVLVFLVFQRMTGTCWRSAALAALFALHPLRVESVAWVAERKDVLSTFFWVLTMWAYTRYVEEKRQNAECKMRNSASRATPRALRFYVLSLSFFAFGLMSKPMLVSLPFVLLLMDYWPLRRFELGSQPSTLNAILPLLREKLPFLVLAVFCSVVTWRIQSTAGAMAYDLPLGLRLANIPPSYLRYLGKVFWPANLAVFYPHPLWWPAWQVAGSMALLLVLLAIAILLAQSRPYFLFGWLWFYGTFVPVIGLVQVGNQSIADRYTYVPSIGLFVMLVWGAYDLTGRWRYRRVALAGCAVVLALLCTVLTHRQIGYWKDDESLWGHAIAATEINGFAHLKLGAALAGKERLEEAMDHFEEAIRFSPRDDRAYTGMARVLAQKRRLAEAIQQYEAALRLNPGDAGLHNDLALTLARQGRGKEAIQHYKEALRLKRGFAEAHYNLGLTLASQGDYNGAAAQFQEVARLDPHNEKARQKLEQALAAQEQLERVVAPYREAVKVNADDARAHRELGRVLLEAGQVDEAIEQCAEAARLEPKRAEIQYQLGAALARKGEAEKAARQFELALELDRNFVAAHYALGIIYQQQSRIPEALEHWREAARLAPEWPEPLNNLAWALATEPRAELRDGVEAVKAATRAVELAGTNNVGVLDTLAASYAEAGRFAEATATAQQAQATAVAQGRADLAEQIGQRLALYGFRQPYREYPGAK